MDNEKIQRMRAACMDYLRPRGNMQERENYFIRSFKDRLTWENTCGPTDVLAVLDQLTTLQAKLEAAEKDAERKADALHELTQWCDAYPVKIFPEPDFAKAHELLQAGGMTLDAISASNMRHVLDGVRKIIDAAIAASKEVGK
jgi:hypothetical protein